MYPRQGQDPPYGRRPGDGPSGREARPSYPPRQEQQPQGYPPQGYEDPYGRAAARGDEARRAHDAPAGYDDAAGYDAPRGYQAQPGYDRPYGSDQRQGYDDPYGPPARVYEPSRRDETSWRDEDSEEPTGKNGFAVAALIFGILGGLCLGGFIFGVLGLVRAKKVGRGKAMSWAGIVLSVIWLGVGAYVGTQVGSHVAKAMDPGCVAAKDAMFGANAPDLGKEKDIRTFEADVQSYIDKFNDAAAKSKDPAARAAIKNGAADFQQLLTDLQHHKQPTDAETNKVNADFTAIDAACGSGLGLPGSH